MAKIIRSQQDFQKIYGDISTISPRSYELLGILEQHLPGTLDEVLKTGKFPKDAEKYLSNIALNDQNPETRSQYRDVLNIVSSLPKKGAALLNFINKVKTNIGVLSNEDYLLAQGAAGEIKNREQVGQHLDQTKLDADIKQILQQHYAKQGLPIPTDIDKAVGGTRDAIINSVRGGAGTQGLHGEIGIGVSISGGDQDKLDKIYNDIKSGKYLTTERDLLPGEETTLKDVDTALAARAKKEDIDTAVSGYLSSLPGELAKNREGYIASLKEQAKGTLANELYPEALASLNVRGLAEQPNEVAGELAKSGYGLTGQIEDVNLKMLEDEIAFYSNAAYQNELRKSAETQSDFGAFLANERQGQLTKQQNEFTASQNDLNRQYNEGMARRRNERALYAEAVRQRNYADVANRQSRRALFGQIGSGGGALVGGLAGSLAGPMGTYIGATAGSQIGGSAGGLFE